MLKKKHRGIGLAFFLIGCYCITFKAKKVMEKHGTSFTLVVNGKMFGIFNINAVKILMEFRQFRNKPWKYVRISNIPYFGITIKPQ